MQLDMHLTSLHFFNQILAIKFNHQCAVGESDEATNSIWNSAYNPTTPIDPDEEDLHFVKVITPFEMVTRHNFIAPTEKPPPDRGGRYQLTPELAIKLQKLDFYFMQLAILAEDCRRRLLCEVADQQVDFQPLSFVLMEESRYGFEDFPLLNFNRFPGQHKF
jgi:hypothetical protein